MLATFLVVEKGRRITRKKAIVGILLVLVGTKLGTSQQLNYKERKDVAWLWEKSDADKNNNLEKSKEKSLHS